MSSLKARLLQKKREQHAQLSSKQPDTGKAVQDNRWQALQAFVQNAGSTSFVRRQIRYDLTTRHGQYELRQIEMMGGVFPTLFQIQAEQSPHRSDSFMERLLFFDTETTGLGVGVGNVPFMIGFGYFHQNQFVVDQCLVRNAAEEHAMLSYARRLFIERPFLVSYNGRTFDWPIVKNRFIVNRIDDEQWRQFEPFHLDLLYTARSLWKHVLSSCRLGTVEMEKLGVSRQNDVPGSLAPELYFRYLQQQDPAILKGVFEHNEQDILSLVTLSIQIAHYLSGSFDENTLSAEELYRLVLWLERMERPDVAKRVYMALKRRRGRALPEYFIQLAEHFKRKQDWQEATDLWQLSIEERERFGQKGRNVHAYIELAKYYEHRVKDLEQALVYAEKAKQEIVGHPLHRIRITRNRLLTQEIEHRIARLQRKLGYTTTNGEILQSRNSSGNQTIIQQTMW